MDERVARLAGWGGGIAQSPTQIQVHLTNFCNLSCLFCPTRTLVREEDLKRENELPLERWLSLIDESAGMGVREWHICGGGEPLFRPDALQIMGHIKKAGLLGECITNGTFISRDTAMQLVDAGWNKITISLDSSDEQTHDSLRGVPGTFRRVKHGIACLAEAKKSLGRDRPQICIHAVICNRNHDHIEDLITFASKTGCNEVLINAMNIWSGKIKKLALGPRQVPGLYAHLKKAQAAAEELQVSTNIPMFLDSDLFQSANRMQDTFISDTGNLQAQEFWSIPCFHPWYNISIFADGSAQPCFLLQEKGDSVACRSLAEVWHGNYFTRKRQEIADRKLTDDCSRCNPWTLSATRELREGLKGCAR
ncbi:MAG: radical SAM protein [archaeon]